MQMNRKNWNPTRTRPQKNQRPALRFSPLAWAKLLFLRDLGPTEVGGFAISDAQDLLYLEDFVLIRQECSPVTVAFDDDAVAEFFDAQIDVGRRPAQFARVWVHTHPGSSATPSRVDEETFARVFGRSDWPKQSVRAVSAQLNAAASRRKVKYPPMSETRACEVNHSDLTGLHTTMPSRGLVSIVTGCMRMTSSTARRRCSGNSAQLVSAAGSSWVTYTEESIAVMGHPSGVCAVPRRRTAILRTAIP